MMHASLRRLLFPGSPQDFLAHQTTRHATAATTKTATQTFTVVVTTGNVVVQDSDLHRERGGRKEVLVDSDSGAKEGHNVQDRRGEGGGSRAPKFADLEGGAHAHGGHGSDHGSDHRPKFHASRHGSDHGRRRVIFEDDATEDGAHDYHDEDEYHREGAARWERMTAADEARQRRRVASDWPGGPRSETALPYSREEDSGAVWDHADSAAADHRRPASEDPMAAVVPLKKKKKKDADEEEWDRADPGSGVQVFSATGGASSGAAEGLPPTTPKISPPVKPVLPNSDGGKTSKLRADLESGSRGSASKSKNSKDAYSFLQERLEQRAVQRRDPVKGGELWIPRDDAGGAAEYDELNEEKLQDRRIEV